MVYAAEDPQKADPIAARCERRKCGNNGPEHVQQGGERNYSITSSARTSSVDGNVIPSVFAVLRLRSNSYFVGCSTGNSAGLAPFNTLSTKDAARRHTSV